MADNEKRYWFNVETHQVEDGPQSDWSKRLGPFATPEEAAKALDKVKERNEKWDAEDEEDRNWGYSN